MTGFLLLNIGSNTELLNAIFSERTKGISNSNVFFIFLFQDDELCSKDLGGPSDQTNSMNCGAENIVKSINTNPYNCSS